MLAAVIAGAAAQGAAGASPPCAPAAPEVFVERFVPADCERCWAARDERAAPPGALSIDWIVPAGDDAPMAVAALAEGAARAGRRPAGDTVVRRAALPAPAPARLAIDHGPAWHRYIAVQLTVSRAAPWHPAARAWLALVEQVPAGSDGTAIERRLVRGVAGPLALDELGEATVAERLHAMALPEGSRAERLAGVAWIEMPDGQVLAAGVSRDPRCR